MTNISIPRNATRSGSSSHDCASCGTPFSPKQKRHIYCSTKCRNKQKWLRTKAAGRVYPRKGNQYLQRYIYKAYCTLRKQIRSFRLDRMLTVHPLTTPDDAEAA
jgi:hypothetical protein